jgi:hypothetical protein
MADLVVANIQSALETVYGPTSMVAALAETLVDSWANYQEEEDTGWRSVEDSVHLTIWNWFPGGDTARIAAKRVMAATSG